MNCKVLPQMRRVCSRVNVCTGYIRQCSKERNIFSYVCILCFVNKTLFLYMSFFLLQMKIFLFIQILLCFSSLTVHILCAFQYLKTKVDDGRELRLSLLEREEQLLYYFNSHKYLYCMPHSMIAFAEEEWYFLADGVG